MGVFQKGHIANPNGGRRARIVSQQIIAALNETVGKGPTKLRLLVEKLIALAAEGDMAAMREVFDRAEGKPIQESNITVDDKRDATDWTREELVAFLNDAKAGSNGAAKANGSDPEPDSVH